ncbi:MAG: hypothetical protein ACKOCW_06895 [Planctomycetaceae bacterium]
MAIGTVVQVEDQDDGGGLMRIRVARRSVALARDAAAKLFVVAADAGTA